MCMHSLGFVKLFFNRVFFSCVAGFWLLEWGTSDVFELEVTVLFSDCELLFLVHWDETIRDKHMAEFSWRLSFFWFFKLRAVFGLMLFWNVIGWGIVIFYTGRRFLVFFSGWVWTDALRFGTWMFFWSQLCSEFQRSSWWLHSSSENSW